MNNVQLKFYWIVANALRLLILYIVKPDDRKYSGAAKMIFDIDNFLDYLIEEHSHE